MSGFLSLSFYPYQKPLLSLIIINCLYLFPFASELLEVVDSQRKRLRRLRNKYIRQGSKKDGEAQDEDQKPPSRPSSRDGNQRPQSRPSSRSRTDTDNRESKGKSRPNTPGSSLKR